jgi:hypothetical protein
MATIGKVSAVFTASSSGLRTGVNQASRSMKQMEGSVTSLRNQMRTLVAIQGAQLFGSIASATGSAVRSLLQFGNAASQTIDNQSKMAQQAGFTYAEFAGLGLAAELAGVGADQLSGAITRANVTIAKAAEGSKTASAALSRIGLSIDQLDGLSASEQFDKIAAAIGQLPAGAEQAAAAVAIFGRSGAQLLPLFQGGAEGIARARAEAEAFGLALTNTQATNVEAMNDAFTRAQSAIQGVIQQVVAYLAPAIESVTTAFSDLIGGIGGANIGQFIGEGILQGARFFAEIADVFIVQAAGVFQYLSNVAGQWAAVWEVGNRAASLFFSVARFLQGAFFTLVGVFTGIGEAIVGAVRSAAGALGFDTAELDKYLAGLRGFNEQINQDITSSFNAAGQNFSNVFSTAADDAGNAAAGPLVSLIDDATRRADAAAAARDEAINQTLNIKQPAVQIDASPIREAVKGIDSRSAEGIREMFRIMRGEPKDDIAREQLEVQREIARNTRDFGEDLDFDVVELAPAAGG